MKVVIFIGMVNDLDRKLQNFDINKLIENVKNGSIDKDRAKKFVDDVYQLEEDLIIMDCNKDIK